MRHSDSGLLAVNDFVYTTSHRIKVFHDNGSNEYRLSINPVELSDGSLYECQVSTTPHTSHFMAISVIGKVLQGLILWEGMGNLRIQRTQRMYLVYISYAIILSKSK